MQSTTHKMFAGKDKEVIPCDRSCESMHNVQCMHIACTTCPTHLFVMGPKYHRRYESLILALAVQMYCDSAQPNNESTCIDNRQSTGASRAMNEWIK